MARGALHHVAVTVSDLAGSEARFYGPLLGFFGYEKVEDIPGQMTVWFNPQAGMAFNIWQAESHLKGRPHERYAPGFHNCAFAVDSRDEVEAVHAFLLESNIPVLDEPAEYPQYVPGYYAVFFEDNDHLKYEAVYMPPLAS